MLSLSAMPLFQHKKFSAGGHSPLVPHFFALSHPFVSLLLMQKFQRVKEQKLKPPHTPEPEVAAGEERVADLGARGATRVVGVADPVAAAQHTLAPSSRSSWISSGWLTIRRPIPVPTPLIHIPSHVVKPVTVRRK